MSANSPVYLSALGMLNALGASTSEILTRLMAGDTSGMVAETGWLHEGAATVGKVTAALPELPAAIFSHYSRNNRLLAAAAAQIADEIDRAKAAYGPQRIGVVIGTSTSGIAEGTRAVAEWKRSGKLPTWFHYSQQEPGSPARFLSDYLGLSGPAYVVSTACTSSAKAIASARNLIRLGLCDAVIAGGADTLCKLTINGFTALESVSPVLCQPMSANRRGINIGEAAAVFLVGREPAPIELLGVGESSDAYHISSPEPHGLGAEAAMRAALDDAGLMAEAIRYLNLHGTATPKNDEMEALATQLVFPAGVPTSSTKPLTGHTLGAAGATELGFCWLALSAYNSGRLLPPHVWDGAADPSLPRLELAQAGQTFPAGRNFVMSNSYAFGGNNISLIIGHRQ